MNNLTFKILSIGMTLLSLAVNADDVDNILLKNMKALNIPGVQLAVIQNNKIVKLANYGIANIQDNVVVTDKSIFTINSITKSFVGVAIMQLVEAGKLKLSDIASNYLSELPSAWQNITIKQLLTNTSGLPSIEVDNKLISPQGGDAAWQLVKTLPMAAKANTQFQYTSTNYVLLKKIITKVSGMPFTEFIKKNQLAKARMEQTESAGFSHFQGVVPYQARGYTYYFGNELSTIQYELAPILQASAGMSSNAQEMARWVIALQSGDLLKKPSSLKSLWSPAVLDNGKMVGFNRFLNGYALGWQTINRENYPAVAAVGGDRSAVVIYPEENLAIIVLTNLMGASPESFIDEIAGVYISGMEVINGVDVAESTLKNYVGRYYFSGFTIDVTLEDNKISFLASGEGQEQFIVYAKSDKSFFAKVIDLQASFERNATNMAPLLSIYQGGKTYLGTRKR